jgi:hypothetical protein
MNRIDACLPPRLIVSLFVVHAVHWGIAKVAILLASALFALDWSAKFWYVYLAAWFVTILAMLYSRTPFTEKSDATTTFSTSRVTGNIEEEYEDEL